MVAIINKHRTKQNAKSGVVILIQEDGDDVCRVKIIFTLLPTNSFVSTRTNSMKCFCKLDSNENQSSSRNTQPHVKLCIRRPRKTEITVFRIMLLQAHSQGALAPTLLRATRNQLIRMPRQAKKNNREGRPSLSCFSTFFFDNQKRKANYSLV